MVNLDKKTEVLDGVTTETYFKYNLIGQVVRDSVYNSSGSLYQTIYKYPYDLAYSDPVLMSMKNENVLDKLVTKEVQNPVYGTYKEKNTYGLTQSLSNPFNSDITKIFSVIQGDIFRNDLINYYQRDFYAYNPKLVKAKRENDISTSYLWGYNQTVPICKALNADNTEISYTGFEIAGEYGGWNYQSGTMASTYSRTGKYSCNDAIMNKPISVNSTVSLWAKTGSANPIISGYTPKTYAIIDGWTYYEWNVNPGTITVSCSGCYIDDLRLLPVGAMMTTYTYEPLVGLTSMTDPDGNTTKYEYDSFGRLKLVRDNNSKITSRNYYHYYNDPSSDAPYLNTSPTTLSFVSSASSSTLSISSNCSWSASDNASWLSVGSATGSGNATIPVNVTANTGAARNATITLTYSGGLTKAVVVYQAAQASSSLTVNYQGITFPSTASPVSVLVTSNTSWTVSKTATWITLSGTTGTGNGTIEIGATKLLSGTRSGTVTFKTTDNTVTRVIQIYQDSGAMQQKIVLL